MKLAVFDIGGTAVKSCFFENGELSNKTSFATPATFSALVEKMKAYIQNSETSGIAISAPGIVDQKSKRIDGFSAVPYLHDRPIFMELEQQLGKQVTIENDANCAGICEIKIGAGKKYHNVAFIVIGTGVGGAIFIDKKLYKGAHLFGGEFGLMKDGDGTILSMDGTIVKAVEMYQKNTNTIDLNGEKLYKLAENGDMLAQNLIEAVYNKLANALYNLQVAFDFDAFVIGGGISARKGFDQELKTRLFERLKFENAVAIMPEIKNCEYHNDANLYGAAFNFMETQAKF